MPSTDLEPRTSNDQEDLDRESTFLERVFIALLVWRYNGLPSFKRKRRKGKKPPSRGIDRNINHGEDGYAWAWFELKTVKAWDMLGKSQKEAAKEGLRAALSAFPNRHFHLWIEAADIDLAEADERWKQGIMYDEPEIHANHEIHRQMMAEWIKAHDFKERRVFLGLRLHERRAFPELVLSKLMLMLGRKPAIALGDPEVLYSSQMDKLMQTFEAHRLELRPLHQRELIELIRRSVWRGHERPYGVNFDEDAPIKSGSELARLSDSTAFDGQDHIAVKRRGQEVLVSYLSVANIEDDETPWLFTTDQRRAPVETSIRFEVVSSQRKRAKARHIAHVMKKTKGELKKGNRGGRNSEHIERINGQIERARTVESRARQNEHGIQAHASMIVTARDVKTLRERQIRLIESCSARDFTLEIDEAYQLEQRRTSYPGAKPEYDGYPLDMFVVGISDAVPHATSAFGDGGSAHGVVLGRQIYPFLYSHSSTLRKDVDAGTGQVFIGPPGSGKTDAMLERAAVDARDGFAVIFDEGKGDTSVLTDQDIPLVATKHLNLANFPGLLNPFRFSDNLKECQDLALQLLMRFTKSEREPGWKGYMEAVISDELTEYGKQASWGRIINERLTKADGPDREEVRSKQAIGRALQSILRTTHADVIFGDQYAWQDLAQDYLRPGQVTYVRYDELTIPQHTQEENYSDPERLGVVIRDLTNVLYLTVASTPEVPVSIYKDEIHLDAFLQGSYVVDRLGRIGRSKRTLISLGSQSIFDIPGKFLEYCSTYYIFRQKTREAALRVIEILDMEVEDEAHREYLIRRITSSDPKRKYVALVKIHNGQIGWVSLKQVHLQGRFVSNYEQMQARKLAIGDVPVAELPQ